MSNRPVLEAVSETRPTVSSAELSIEDRISNGTELEDARNNQRAYISRLIDSNGVLKQIKVINITGREIVARLVTVTDGSIELVCNEVDSERMPIRFKIEIRKI